MRKERVATEVRGRCGGGGLMPQGGRRVSAQQWSGIAALKEAGAVITWGDPIYGGNSNQVAKELRSGIVEVYAADGAFAALSKTGSVTVWGNRLHGGAVDAERRGLLSAGVSRIYVNGLAFAALKEAGCYVT
eukprot:CAMPEP_0171144718 /NCGR_PEP_ID=MMETSP0766_2-20121228/146419_1 /TAXON_ID=439317 /ORGANISM="Gambierdiscus australes, Strain CAWD 149" /LENGTH=131 /DNA_ID=CAMNT_0011608581 /DNA_START=205 /DNA_END=601 /DNA_ORIENTATION=-